jgi:hypothetical protein
MAKQSRSEDWKEHKADICVRVSYSRTFQEHALHSKDWKVDFALAPFLIANMKFELQHQAYTIEIYWK